MSIKSVMRFNHLILCHSLLLLPSIFLNIRIFSNGQLFASGGQNIGVSASASVLPMNTQDWFPLGIIYIDKPEKAMAPHSSTLAWKIPWAEEPGRLQSMGSLGVGHDWVTLLSIFTFVHWGGKWQPTPVFLPGESQGQRSLVGCCLWGRTELDTTEYSVYSLYLKKQKQKQNKQTQKLIISTWFSHCVIFCNISVIGVINFFSS